MASVFTIFYGLSVGWIIGPRDIFGFLANDSTPLNNTGDFLAGAFAPIALIWLVAAVLTQRQELQVTKAELHEARIQFTQNQDAITAQLDLVRDQNDKVQAQAVRNYKLSLFDARFQIVEALAEVHKSAQFDVNAWEHSKALRQLSEKSLFVYGEDIASKLDKIADEFERVVEIVDTIKNEFPSNAWNVPTKPSDEEGASRWDALVVEKENLLDKLVDRLGRAGRVTLLGKYLTVADESLDK